MATLLILLSSLAYGKLWIIGDDYLAFYNSHILTQKKLTALSWGFDKKNCGIWFTDEHHDLFYTEKDFYIQKKDSQCTRIVSEINNDIFFTIDNGKLTKRNKYGIILQSYSINGLNTLTLVNQHQNVAFYYENDENKFSVSHLNNDFKEVKRILLVQEKVLWQEPKVLFSEKNEFWLGYTAQIGKLSYTPVIEKRNIDGDMLKSFHFNTKGVFFDFCYDTYSKNILFSRDISSSSGFTVPVYSMIQKINSSFELENVHDSQTNYLIDTLNCNRDELIFSERSIFSTSIVMLIFFPKYKTINLPNKVRKIFICE